MENIEIKHGLNSRQFALYRHLKDKGDTWTTQEQLARELKDFYFDNDLDKPFHDRRVRMLMTVDIRAINESEYIHKPILSTARGVKLANEAEFDKFIASNINSAVRRLKRLKKLASKANLNGQYRIKMSQYQKEIYESFIEDGLEM